MSHSTKQATPLRPWLHLDAGVAVLVQGQGVHGGTVTQIDDQGIWVRWNVGTWTQRPGDEDRVDLFDAHTLTDVAQWIRARILAPDEGVAVPAVPVIHDEAELTRWPYVELSVAVSEYPCAVPDCTRHSTGEPFDPGRELLFWLGAALSDFDRRSDLYVKMASRLAPPDVDIPKGRPSFGPVRGAFALTHVPLPDAAEIAALPAWAFHTTPGSLTLEGLQLIAQANPDDVWTAFDLDVRPALRLAEDEHPTPETIWWIRVTNAYDLTPDDAILSDFIP